MRKAAQPKRIIFVIRIYSSRSFVENQKNEKTIYGNHTRYGHTNCAVKGIARSIGDCI